MRTDKLYNLKRCPFCGHKAYISNSNEYIYCNICGCKMYDTTNLDTHTLATRWNSRITDPMDNKVLEQQLRNMPENSCVYTNWANEGGVEIKRVNNVYVVFAVPLYGGEPQYIDTFRNKDIHKIVLRCAELT